MVLTSIHLLIYILYYSFGIFHQVQNGCNYEDNNEKWGWQGCDNRHEKLFNDEVKTNFLDFITNYFFNLSYSDIDDVEQTYNTLPEYLGQHLGTLMNMTINDQIEDTIVFYLIDGKYLVPGSEILRAYQAVENQLNVNITIKSSYQGFTDVDYATTKYADDKKKDELVRTSQDALSYIYWRGSRESGWRPTSENRTEYNEVLSHIQFITQFNPLQMLEDYLILYKK